MDPALGEVTWSSRNVYLLRRLEMEVGYEVHTSRLVRAVQLRGSSPGVLSQNLGKTPEPPPFHSGARSRVRKRRTRGPGNIKRPPSMVDGEWFRRPPHHTNLTDDHPVSPAWAAAAHQPTCMRVLQIICLLCAPGPGLRGPLKKQRTARGGNQEKATMSRDNLGKTQVAKLSPREAQFAMWANDIRPIGFCLGRVRSSSQKKRTGRQGGRRGRQEGKTARGVGQGKLGHNGNGDEDDDVVRVL